MNQTKSTARKIIWIALACLLLLLLACCLLWYVGRPKSADYETQVIAPTCTENGYTIYRSLKDGSTRFKDVTEPLGHTFGDWLEAEGRRERTCSSCGFIEAETVTVADDMPVLSLYGSLEGIEKSNDVPLTFSYADKSTAISGYATMKTQGHGSLAYEKKNFTIKLFEDEQYKTKKKISFNNWHKEHKYILKANFVDGSSIRNLVCADIWSQMVESRPNVSSRLLNTSHNGAVDGFPLELRLNDAFYGLYTLTLHKDDDLFAMEDGEKSGILISNEGDFDEALFQKPVDWQADETWEVEYCGTEKKTWLQNQFNDFLSFVATADDKSFKKKLYKYADVPSLIDYMIATYTLGLTDKDHKDILFVTYDKSPFIASLFDMETAFGLTPDGTAVSPPNEKLPMHKDGGWAYNTENILFQKMLNCFDDEICQRYGELRKTVLSDEAILKIIESRAAQIAPTVRDSDFALYPTRPGADSADVTQLKAYCETRFSLTDTIFMKGSPQE